MTVGATRKKKKRTFSSNSSILASVLRSSSDGLGGILTADENCEYVWNKFSVCGGLATRVSICHGRMHGFERCKGTAPGLQHTWVSNDLACCRSCAQPALDADAAMLTLFLVGDDVSSSGCRRTRTPGSTRNKTKPGEWTTVVTSPESRLRSTQTDRPARGNTGRIHDFTAR